eukprot:m.314797 g.314797  ORF g.314797 m.314797 type:complete len:206 (+) comp55422_c1_seq12:398-1015(+)
MQPHDRSPSRALLARDSKYKATSSQHDDELTGIADSYLVDLSDQHARGEDDPGAVLSHASLFTPHELQDLISALKKLLRSLESCEFAPASEPVPQKKRRISNLWVENLLLITFVWQALTLLVLWVIDNSTSSDSNAGVIAAVRPFVCVVVSLLAVSPDFSLRLSPWPSSSLCTWSSSSLSLSSSASSWCIALRRTLCWHNRICRL